VCRSKHRKPDQQWSGFCISSAQLSYLTYPSSSLSRTIAKGRTGNMINGHIGDEFLLFP